MFVIGSQKFTIVKEPIPHIRIENFAGEEQSKKILDHFISMEKFFEPATITEAKKVDTAYRNNMSCMIDKIFQTEGSWEMRKMFRKEHSPLLELIDSFIEADFTRQLMDTAPHPLCKFRDCDTWETQVSRYGDNGHYKWHQDRFLSDSRLITLVYYAFREPKKFHGGELTLTNAMMYQGELIGNGDMIEIEPKHDMAIIFPSRAVHAVNATISPEEFGDGRFSVNTWIGRLNGMPPGSIY